MKHVLICGDRKYTDYRRIEGAVRKEKAELGKVFVGGASGADKLGENACRFLRVPYEVTEAKWRQEGLGAGPLRNQRQLMKLLRFEGIKEVWAFHEDFERSVGTKDMVTRAVQAGIPVRLYGKGEGWTKWPDRDNIVLCRYCGGEKLLPQMLAYKIRCQADFHVTSDKSDESSDTF